jgi:uncharacterized integral membrane protein
VTIPEDAWPFIWVLTAFKAFTLVLILWFAVPWDGSAHFVWVHSLPVFFFLGAALLGPAVFFVRLLRVRRRRRRLIEAEFRTD